MLVPEDSEGDGAASIDSYEWAFESLGAVNLMGEVGDNANLYYSLWVSLALSMALAYEMAGMAILQCRSARRAADAAEAWDFSRSADCAAEADCSRAADCAVGAGCGRFGGPLGGDDDNAGNAPAATATATATPAGRDWNANLSRREMHRREQKPDSLKAIETVLDWTAERISEEIREARDTWYNSLYKLRLRTGIWVAALVANVVALTSAARVWRNVMVPAAQSVSDAAGVDADNLGWGVCALVESEVEVWGDDRFIRAFTGNDDDAHANGSVGFHVVPFHPDMCQRTEMSVAIGAMSSFLSLCAIVSHSFLRRRAAAIAAGPAPHRHDPPEEHVHRTCCGNVIPLRAEFGLSVLLALTLGVNAIYATGVGGPAQMVGNLYYSVWLGFLLSVRIGVACLEEIFDVHELDGGLDEEDRKSLPNAGMIFKGMRERPLDARKEIVTKIVMLSDSYAASDVVTPRGDIQLRHSGDFFQPSDVCGETPHLETLESMGALEDEDETDSSAGAANKGGEQFRDEASEGEGNDDAASGGDNVIDDWMGTKDERSKRLRRWCSIAVFSTLCAFSALDAARNEPDGGYSLTTAQRYMLICPSVVAFGTFLVFLMCLQPVTYALVNDFRFGGVASLLTFGAWLSNLVVTMHSDSTWAVNAIGDIKMANLYYFAWSSIITAGLQMSSYVKKFLGLKPRSIMIILWFAIVKVCFVVFGAGFHIWHNIHENCEATAAGSDEGEPISFCRRTAFSIVVGLVGMAVGSLVVLCRIVDKRETTVRLIIEMVLSLLLAGFFAFGAAVITGIGGPGQSVGDLYYAMWLSFLVSLGVAKGCFDQLKVRRKMKLQVTRALSSSPSLGRDAPGHDTVGMRTSKMPFVRMMD
uniref:Uncharacterized protein n=1 Tax=Odontella aurita TaxID=265563 RepID=A0A7S4MZN4_9STRA